MIELLLFILIGAVMYLIQWMVRVQSGGKKILVYVVSGLVGGLIASLLAEYTLPLQASMIGEAVWPGMMIMGLIGGIVLYLASALNLYQSSLFQMFSTLLLGIATGLITLGVYTVYAAIARIPWLIVSQIGHKRFSFTIIMFCVLGFLIIFGYAMTARFIVRFRRTK